MKARAASSEGTTATLRTRSRYSVSQSASVAGFRSGTRARLAASPRSSQPRAPSAAAIRGRNCGATAWCTSRFSIALHTLGRSTFALRQMRSAMEVGALVDVEVADALEVLHHRDAALLEDGVLERLAAARDDDVDAVVALQEPARHLAPALDQLHGRGGQPGGLDLGAEPPGDGAG